MSTNQLYAWAFTCWNMEAKEELHAWLNANCKKYIFQHERGEETKGDHLQGQMSLKTKKKQHELVNMFKGTGFETMQVRPTHKEESSAHYCGALETRIAGPWFKGPYEVAVERKRKRDEITDEEIEAEWEKEYGNAVLKPWQQQVDIILATKEPRTVHWIYNPKGNEGKSWFTNYCQHHYGTVGLTFGKASDLLYLVSKTKSRAYIFDLSRNATVEMSEIYAALESIKNGSFISTKYECVHVKLHQPSCVVFSNHMPDTERLSADRWRVYTITDDWLIPIAKSNDQGGAGAGAVTPRPPS